MEKVLIGTVGVVLGSVLTLLREFWSDHRSQQKKAAYLAVRVTCILERFFDGCVSVALDEGERDQYECLITTTSKPNLNFESLDVDWQSLPFDLMYEILNFPSDVEEANLYIDSASEYVAHPPDYEEAFEERQFQYSTLGLKAHDLSTRLRSKYGMPKNEYENWNPVTRILTIKKEIESLKKERGKRYAEMHKIAQQENL